MSKCKNKKCVIILAILAIIAAVFLAAAAMKLWGGFPAIIRGGELSEGDFSNGYELYIKERSSDGEYPIWRVTDTHLKQKIYEICLNISQYREFDVAGDIVLGDSTTEGGYLPGIFFDCGNVGYKITIVDWESYLGNEWSGLSIKNEAFGEPILRVWRIDLTDLPEGTDRLDYLETYSQSDSVNSGMGRWGWYSSLPQEELEKLLEILSWVDERCGEAASLT